MPRQKKAQRRGKRVLWTAADVRILRKSAGRKSRAEIARELKRSEAAVKRKAVLQRISLRRR